MNASSATALVLRVFVTLGILIMVVGLLVSGDIGNDILFLGILVLVSAPLLGVITTFFALISEKDTYWIKVCAVLLIIMGIGIVVSIVW